MLAEVFLIPLPHFYFKTRPKPHRHWSCYTRPTISQFLSSIVWEWTFLNYIKCVDPRILRLWNLLHAQSGIGRYSRTSISIEREDVTSIEVTDGDEIHLISFVTYIEKDWSGFFSFFLSGILLVYLIHSLGDWMMASVGQQQQQKKRTNAGCTLEKESSGRRHWW